MAYRYSKVITKGGMTRSSAKSHIACEQALLFGQAKRASRVLEGPVSCTHPNRRAGSQAKSHIRQLKNHDEVHDDDVC